MVYIFPENLFNLRRFRSLKFFDAWFLKHFCKELLLRTKVKNYYNYVQRCHGNSNFSGILCYKAVNLILMSSRKFNGMSFRRHFRRLHGKIKLLKRIYEYTIILLLLTIYYRVKLIL